MNPPETSRRANTGDRFDCRLRSALWVARLVRGRGIDVRWIVGILFGVSELASFGGCTLGLTAGCQFNFLNFDDAIAPGRVGQKEGGASDALRKRIQFIFRFPTSRTYPSCLRPWRWCGDLAICLPSCRLRQCVSCRHLVADQIFKPNTVEGVSRVQVSILLVKVPS